MAEPMSIIAGISSVTSLADVSCSLAGSLYKAFRAIKDAPRAVQKLSKELEQLHGLLQDVDNLLRRYSTSLLVTEDGLSINSVQSVLLKCQTELEEVQKIAGTFKRQPSKLKNAAARVRWVFDEQKIKQHRQTIEQLRQDVDTGLSVLSHRYDINARERDKSLHSQVTEVRNVLDTCATETRNLVSSEVGTIRSDIEQVFVKVAHSQEGMQTDIQASHNHLYQEVSNTGVQTSHGMKKIQNDIRDTNLLVQRNRQHTMQEFLQLNQSIKNIDSMLSRVLSLYSEREESLLDCSLAQHPRLEGLMLSLLMMKSSLVSTVSELKSKSSLEISEEETEFLLNEFENLVAFSHDASALRIRQRCIKAEGEDRPSRGSTNYTSMTRNYALDIDSFSQPTVTRRERLRTLYHSDASGQLRLKFEYRAGDVNGQPASVLNTSFSYVPNIDVQRTGVYASFRKEMRMGLNPSIKRSLRVIRIFHDDDSTYGQLKKVFEADDLHGLQRMLSCGQIRPWDRWRGRNLLSMALYWVDHLPSKVIDYLLVDSWDIENSNKVQTILWCNLANESSWHHSRKLTNLDSIYRVSRRVSVLGQVVQANLIHHIVRYIPINISPWKELKSNDICKFLIDHGAKIECRDSLRMETALLVAAEVDSIMSLRMMPALLWLDADYSAVDYKGRGPLHLALKPSRFYLGEDQRLHPRTLKDKLVPLLQAGCSSHAVDNYGRTPTYVARKWRRTKAWEAALQEVGKLECGESECQCEIITEHFGSSTGHPWESSSAISEDSEVDGHSAYTEDSEVDGHIAYTVDRRFFDDEDNDRLSETNDRLSEMNDWLSDISRDSEQDGDSEEGEDQDADPNEHEHNNQRTDTDKEESEAQNPEQGKGEDEALDKDLNLAGGKHSARNESNIDINTPQVPEPDPSPAPESHHETIALGQHHLWMI